MLAQYDLDKDTGLGVLMWIDIDDGRISEGSMRLLGRIRKESEGYKAFRGALYAVLLNLARMCAADGEGATKLIECVVSGAASEESAVTIAKSVITSSLFKAAMYGADANWGRILCALGYSGEFFTPEKTSLYFRATSA